MNKRTHTHSIAGNLDIQSGILETGDSYYRIATNGTTVTKAISAENGEALSITCGLQKKAEPQVGPSVSPAQLIKRLCEVSRAASEQWFAESWEYTAADGTIMSWNRNSDSITIEQCDANGVQKVRLSELSAMPVAIGGGANGFSVVAAKKHTGWAIEIRSTGSRIGFQFPAVDDSQLLCAPAEISVQRQMEMSEGELVVAPHGNMTVSDCI